VFQLLLLFYREDVAASSSETLALETTRHYTHEDSNLQTRPEVSAEVKIHTVFDDYGGHREEFSTVLVSVTSRLSTDRGGGGALMLGNHHRSTAMLIPPKNSNGCVKNHGFKGLDMAVGKKC
jgi:hypothetical protein